MRSTEKANHPLLLRLGQHLRTLRTRREWTLQTLAEHSGLSTRFISAMEAGSGNPSILSLEQVAQALDVSLSALLRYAEQGEHSKGGDVRGVVALLGLRGAGKSTLGPLLAQRLGRPFFELDVLIEEASGLSLAELFALHGEQYYRALELKTLQHFLSLHEQAILATSGGIVTNPDAFRLLEDRCRLVWLKARPEEHLERVLRQGDERPVHNHPHAMAELRTLLRAREPLYSRADIVADTSVMDVEACVQFLAKQCKRE